MRSIRQRLLLWLLVGLALVLALSGYATYQQARTEVNTLFDYQLEQTARDLGYSLAELAGSARKGRRAGSKRVSAPGEAKYADPNDPSQTWSGRGRRPRWMVDAMSRGMKPEDLEIGG